MLRFSSGRLCMLGIGFPVYYIAAQLLIICKRYSAQRQQDRNISASFSLPFPGFCKQIRDVAIQYDALRQRGDRCARQSQGLHVERPQKGEMVCNDIPDQRAALAVRQPQKVRPAAARRSPPCASALPNCRNRTWRHFLRPGCIPRWSVSARRSRTSSRLCRSAQPSARMSCWTSPSTSSLEVCGWYTQHA